MSANAGHYIVHVSKAGALTFYGPALAVTRTPWTNRRSRAKVFERKNQVDEALSYLHQTQPPGLGEQLFSIPVRAFAAIYRFARTEMCEAG